MKQTNRNNLKIIRGGQFDKDEAPKEFVEAYATQSRLMGASWVYVRWNVLNSPDAGSLVQFFYIDYDQYGIEDFHNFWDPRREVVKNMEHTTVDCMGSDRIYLDEMQFLKLIYSYHHITLLRGYTLAENHSSYEFILDEYEKPTLRAEHDVQQKFSTKDEVNQKKELNVLETYGEEIFRRISLEVELLLCEPIRTVNSLLTYMLMRFISKDTLIAKQYIKFSEVDNLDIFPDLTTGTLYRNEISELTKLTELKNSKTSSEDNSDIRRFSCRSLLLCKNTYYISNMHFKLDGLTILDVQSVDLIRISSCEAALILSGTEFTSIYKFNSDHLPLPWLSNEFPLANFENSAINGFMYMIFKPDNNHVDRDIFLLNEDMYGSMFVSYENQIILSSRHPDFLNMLRNNLEGVFNRMGLTPYLSHVQSFKLFSNDGSIYDFIDSDFTNFIEFLDLSDNNKQ